jgi:hypothetical protein
MFSLGSSIFTRENGNATVTFVDDVILSGGCLTGLAEP